MDDLPHVDDVVSFLFFVMPLNVGDTVIFAKCSECQRGENFKHARVNGRSNYSSLLRKCLDFCSVPIQLSFGSGRVCYELSM